MNNKKNSAGILTIVILLTVLLNFVFSRHSLSESLYRSFFTVFLIIMFAGTIFTALAFKKTMNKRTKIFHVTGNLLLIILGLAFLYATPELAQYIHFVKNFQLTTPYLSTMLVGIMATYTGFNYSFLVAQKVQILGKHKIYIIAFFFLLLSSLFLINHGALPAQPFLVFLYDFSSGVIFLNFTIELVGIDLKNKLLYFVQNTIITGFLILEVTFLTFAQTLFKISSGIPRYHAIFLLLLSFHFLSASTGSGLLQKHYIKKYTYPNLFFWVFCTGLIYYQYFKTNLTFLAFHLFFSVVFESLWIIGGFFILSRKNYPIFNRAIFILILTFLTIGGITFQFTGPKLIGANLYSYKMLMSLSFLAMLNLTYVFIITNLINTEVHKKALQKKRTKKITKPVAKINKIKPPFMPYKGKGKFVFISYSHRNMENVFGIIKKLFDLGYNIWYDEGIEPGDEWPETLGKAIDKCQQFIVFLSKPAANSRNVRNEINYAFNKKKDMIVIMLEKTKLTEGLDLQLGTVQSINKYEMKDKEFYDLIKKYLKKK